MSKITFPGGSTGGGGGGGVSDHGGLAGLGDDDHAQYLLRSDFATSGTQYALTSGDIANQTIHHFHFNTAPNTAAIEESGGTMHWDADNDTMVLHPVTDPSVGLQLGQEVYFKAVNKTGATISNGTPVKVAGAQGNRPKIWLAQADTAGNFEGFIGLATHDIIDNAEGFIISICAGDRGPADDSTILRGGM